jgi:hypothetical protein
MICSYLIMSAHWKECELEWYHGDFESFVSMKVGRKEFFMIFFTDQFSFPYMENDKDRTESEEILNEKF